MPHIQTAYQRGQIEAMLRLGIPKVNIAKDFGIARFTLYAEIKSGTASHKNLTFREFAEIWEARYNDKMVIATRMSQHFVLHDRMMDAFVGIPLNKITAGIVMSFVEILRNRKTQHKSHPHMRWRIRTLSY